MVFRSGIREAYSLANVSLPKHLQKRNREECRRLVIEYIKNNHTATISEIQNRLGVNIRRLFGGIKEAFNAANIPYPAEQRLLIYQKILD